MTNEGCLTAVEAVIPRLVNMMMIRIMFSLLATMIVVTTVSVSG